MTDNSSEHHFQLAVGISIEALKSLLLLNGGAATALIALMGRSTGSPNYTFSVLFFGLGALLAVLSFVAGYFSQLAYANHRLECENADESSAETMLKRHNFWQGSAIAAVALSVIASSSGMVAAFLAATVR